jgi:hypothetical protein
MMPPRAPGPEGHSFSASDGDPGADRPPPPRSGGPDSTRDVAQEDFLFHLYRGSELLQENRVLEAKEELEFALTMQPSDPKGQDLLGTVYFRLGLYPRAIQIYEALAAVFSRDVAVKINLALCYLKTGQPEPARRVLQDVVGLNPEHRRAWGYLGLALQKLGQIEQAQIAFERGGHALMARRVGEHRQRGSGAPAPRGPDVDSAVRSAAETAFSELDAGELRFALAEPTAPRPSDGVWHMREPGSPAPARGVALSTTLAALLYQDERARMDPVADPAPAPDPAAAHAPATATAPAHAPVTAPATVAAPSPALSPPVSSLPVLLPPADRTVAVLPLGPLVVRTTAERAFAARLDALRAIVGAPTTRVLHRRTRDAQTTDVFGGIGSPFVRVEGESQLVLGARPTCEIVLVALEREPAFLREDTLVGFELGLAYENARLLFDAPGASLRPPGEGLAMVQLRGTGAVALELARKLATVPCTAGRPLLLRREWFVGWLGRLVPRVVLPEESPSGQRGMIGFSGEGIVLVSPG